MQWPVASTHGASPCITQASLEGADWQALIEATTIAKAAKRMFMALLRFPVTAGAVVRECSCRPTPVGHGWTYYCSHRAPSGVIPGDGQCPSGPPSASLVPTRAA